MDKSQTILLGAAALYLLVKIVRGWRAGVVQGLLTPVALVAAYFAGVAFGGLLAAPLRLAGLPELALKPVGAIAAGVAAYLLVKILGRILFRRTTDQSVGIVWFVYGAGGALLGALYGLVVIAAALILLRFFGSFATGLVSVPPPPAAAEPGASPAPPARPAPLPAALAGFRKALDQGPLGEALAAIDPVSPKTHALLEKLGRLATEPRAAYRLLEYPGAAELARRPEVTALRDDPEIAALVRDRQYLQLLKNPKVAKAAQNPEIARLAEKIDLQKALDYALGQGNAPQATPQPPAER